MAFNLYDFGIQLQEKYPRFKEFHQMMRKAIIYFSQKTKPSSPQDIEFIKQKISKEKIAGIYLMSFIFFILYLLSLYIPFFVLSFVVYAAGIIFSKESTIQTNTVSNDMQGISTSSLTKQETQYQQQNTEMKDNSFKKRKKIFLGILNGICALILFSFAYIYLFKPHLLTTIIAKSNILDILPLSAKQIFTSIHPNNKIVLVLFFIILSTLLSAIKLTIYLIYLGLKAHSLKNAPQEIDTKTTIQPAEKPKKEETLLFNVLTLCEELCLCILTYIYFFKFELLSGIITALKTQIPLEFGQDFSIPLTQTTMGFIWIYIIGKFCTALLKTVSYYTYLGFKKLSSPKTIREI